VATGFTRIARRAGIAQATKATAASRAIARERRDAGIRAEPGESRATA